MSDRIFEDGTIIKGKDLKGYMLYKISPEDMVTYEFRYKLGMNETLNYRSGMTFYLAQDICKFLNYGTKLAIISIPDNEDVYVRKMELFSYRLVIEKVFQLNELLNRVSEWECLMLNGADISAGGDSAVQWAAENGYLEVVEYLYKNGADITANENYAVIHASGRGHLEVVKYLYENGADITAHNNEAVRWAAIIGHLEVVKYLHENGADITAHNNEAVRWAANNGHFEVVKYLHENGADIKAQNEFAYRSAEENGHTDIMKYLRANK